MIDRRAKSTDPAQKFCGNCQCWRAPEGGRDKIASNGYTRRWQCGPCWDAAKLRKAKLKVMNGAAR